MVLSLLVAETFQSESWKMTLSLASCFRRVPFSYLGLRVPPAVLPSVTSTHLVASCLSRPQILHYSRAPFGEKQQSQAAGA